jgi:hypothetical protein
MASLREILPPQQKSSFSARNSAVAPGRVEAMSASMRLAKSEWAPMMFFPCP